MSVASVANSAIIVPAGGSVSLGNGTMDLGCTDINVAGDLLVESASLTRIHNVNIVRSTLPDGTLDGGSGSITLSGNWSNDATFVPGTSSVNFVDDPGCAASSAFAGNTTFNNLSLVSSVGKTYTIPPGTTQTINQLLTVRGTSAKPIQITSGFPGNPGYTNLVSSGAQDIFHVGVSDNWAIGQPLAPTQSNEGGAGNARGWFGVLLTLPIPALGIWGLALLTLILGGFGLYFSPARKRHQGHAA